LILKLDDQRSVFSTDDGKVLTAEALIEFNEEFSSVYAEYEISQTYWDISFKYYYIDSSNEKIDILLVLTNKRQYFEITPPNFIEADYFIVDQLVIPIRSNDFMALNKFLPTLDHDGALGFTVKELMNFDYFAASNRFTILNPELKDIILASPNVDLHQFESVLTIQPYPYQAVGIEWLRSQQQLGRHGAILGDVMGLGKTLQAIGLITHNVNEGAKDNLVICPGTLLENWRREFAKFSPNLEVLTHYGAYRAGTAAKLKGYDVVLTTYDALIRDHSMLSTISWNLVVIDEAQAIKNPRAQRTIRCKGLPRKFGLAISGTPLENRLLDLWSLSDFAEPGLFGTESQFENDYEGIANGAAEVNKIIRPVLLRRRLHEIEHQLPEKVVIDHPISWPSEMNEIYERVRIEAIEEFATAGGLVATGRLRKLTTHPLLMDIGPEEMTALSPKYAVTIEILEELFANKEKCLIFASYKKIIDRMTEDIGLRFPGAFVKSLDGRTEMEARSPLVDDFNSFKGPGVLICNPIVAGAGLNITGANHVIHYNLEWNPAKEDQATFRVYRNGQLKETFIHRLFYIDTIDEVIDQRIQMKRNLSDLSVDAAVSSEDYLAGLQISPIGRRDD
jgi:SNF2 family DNA or RNA helicase